MTPTQARAFLAVAIEGSFTGAAKRLNLSQPSVTTQVGLLERQYKVELFHRIGRGPQAGKVDQVGDNAHAIERDAVLDFASARADEVLAGRRAVGSF